jgi:predicted N-acetyltransferase YhbS
MIHSSFFTLVPEHPGDSAAIENLLDIAFGADRFEKSSYLLRVGVGPVEALSLTLRRENCLCGTIRFWPVRIGAGYQALLLGPLGVHPDYQGHRGGQVLMAAGLSKARELGHELVFLVGDIGYYKRAGFVRVPAGRITMPGIYDPQRLLYTELVPGAIKGIEGRLKPYQ